MAYQPLDFPDGMSANGTIYQNAGLWYDGDRVRWHNGLLTPIGGWDRFIAAEDELDQVLPDPVNQRARNIKAWRSNDGTSLYVVGHNQGLKAFTRASSTVYDITPDDFVDQPPGAIVNDGYGDWFYGTSFYGTPRPYNEQSINIFNWCFRTWGQNLLAGQRGAPSKLYEWDSTLTNKAVAIADAPVDFDCFHVTEQRIVVTAGSALEPRLIQWSTSEDNTVWIPTTTNQAGSQTLPGIGRFVEITDFRDQVLLISETDVHAMRYIGPPYIHGFDLVGQNCGCSVGEAVVSTQDFVVWPGDDDFYIYDGSVRRLECSVIDRFQANINTLNRGKMVGYVNQDFAEVWWLYQSGSDEVDSYIVWDFKRNHWFTGTLERTAMGATPALSGPLMMGPDGYLYKHELSGVVPGDDASNVIVESGPIELSNGNTTQYIDSIQPDFIQNGAVDVYLIGRDRPSAPEVTFGPYTIEYPADNVQPIPCRARGHTIRVKIIGRNSAWSLGRLRLNLKRFGGKK